MASRLTPASTLSAGSLRPFMFDTARFTPYGLCGPSGNSRLFGVIVGHSQSNRTGRSPTKDKFAHREENRKMLSLSAR